MSDEVVVVVGVGLVVDLGRCWRRRRGGCEDPVLVCRQEEKTWSMWRVRRGRRASGVRVGVVVRRVRREERVVGWWKSEWTSSSSMGGMNSRGVRGGWEGVRGGGTWVGNVGGFVEGEERLPENVPGVDLCVGAPAVKQVFGLGVDAVLGVLAGGRGLDFADEGPGHGEVPVDGGFAAEVELAARAGVAGYRLLLVEELDVASAAAVRGCSTGMAGGWKGTYLSWETSGKDWVAQERKSRTLNLTGFRLRNGQLRYWSSACGCPSVRGRFPLPPEP